jgi:hypothetical protein
VSRSSRTSASRTSLRKGTTIPGAPSRRPSTARKQRRTVSNALRARSDPLGGDGDSPRRGLVAGGRAGPDQPPAREKEPTERQEVKERRADECRHAAPVFRIVHSVRGCTRSARCRHAPAGLPARSREARTSTGPGFRGRRWEVEPLVVDLLDVRQDPTPVQERRLRGVEPEVGEPGLAGDGRDPVLLPPRFGLSGPIQTSTEPSAFVRMSMRDDRSAIFCSFLIRQRVSTS